MRDPYPDEYKYTQTFTLSTPTKTPRNLLTSGNQFEFGGNQLVRSAT